jgi:hypothetical protein
MKKAFLIVMRDLAIFGSGARFFGLAQNPALNAGKEVDMAYCDIADLRGTYRNVSK